MDKKLFADLVTGIREMKAVMRGTAKPARVTRLAPDSPAVVRVRMGFSQEQFATLLGISVRTLQNWEQGHREPTGAARILIRVAARHPKIVLAAAAA